MQPEQPQQIDPTDIDYLNQIAVPDKPAGLDKKTKIIIGGLIIVGVLSLAMIFAMASQNNNSGPTPLKLVARLQKLQAITKQNTKKLRSSSLQDLNSSLSAILTTANKSIETPILAYDLDLKKLKKEITALDPPTEINEKLADAYLNSTLDSTYVREMKFQLEDTILMMKSLNRTTKVKSMREFLETTIPDFENLVKRFDELPIN